MSDIHTLVTDEDGNCELIFHIPVPDVLNSVNVNLRTALVNSGLGGTTKLALGDGTKGTILQAEKTAIEAGQLYERSYMFPIMTGGITPNQIRATVRARYAAVSQNVVEALTRQLKWYGHIETAT